MNRFANSGLCSCFTARVVLSRVFFQVADRQFKLLDLAVQLFR